MPSKEETLLRTSQIDRWLQVKDRKRRRTDTAVIQNKYIINADGAELKPNGSVVELDWGGQRGGKADPILSYQQVISKAKSAKGYSSHNMTLIW